MKKTLFLMFCFLLTLKGSAQFSGSGSGTSNDPYLIFNPIQLDQVRNFLGRSDVYFKVMSDIDMGPWISDNNPTEGWLPIGVPSSPFMGRLDGNGHTISNLTINRPNTDNVGLFGSTSGAQIRNFTLTGQTTGRSYTGAIVGTSSNFTQLSNITYTGNVTGTDYTGGVVGAGGQQISLSQLRYNGEVVGANYTGGIMGFGERSTLNNVKAIGKVTGANNVGGIVGEMLSPKNLNNSTCEVDIVGGSFVGGVVGNMSYPLEHDFVIPITYKVYYQEKHTGEEIPTFTKNGFKGKINASGRNVGGFIGYTEIYVNLEENYAIADMQVGAENVGGLIGRIGNLVPYTFNSIYSAPDSKYNQEQRYGNQYYKIWEEIFRDLPTNVDIYITNNFSICNIISNSNNVGGLIGCENGHNNREIMKGGTYSSDKEKKVVPTYVNILDNYINGNINGKCQTAGIIGSAYDTRVKKNYSRAIIYGSQKVGGIIGSASDGVIVESNVAINSSISATQADAGRIYGYCSNPSGFGTSGSQQGNKALVTTKISLCGNALEVTDTKQHGTNVGENTLKLKASYQGLGWDFSKDWSIQETECFPYKSSQTAPPVILSGVTANSKLIEGKSMDNGNIVVKINDRTYNAISSGNKWQVPVDALEAGCKVEVYAVANGKVQSYPVVQFANFLGSGTAEDPYLIFTAGDLAGMKSTGFYKLMNDIDLTEWIQKNNPENGWSPLGKNPVKVTHFNGDNHTISGFWIKSQEDFVGLFANSTNIVIENLKVKVASGKKITGGNHSAILIGKATGGEIKNCEVTGDVLGKDNTGCLVGEMSGTQISNCKVIGNATGSNFVGGLVGAASNAEMSKCSVKGNVTGTITVGGLVGNCTAAPATASSFNGKVISTGASATTGGLIGKTNATVSLSYSVGSVQASGSASIAGGLIGTALSTAKVTNSYSSSDVTSVQYVAGLVGYNYGSIDKCYASGNLKGTNIGAGLVGYNDNTTATASNSVAANNIINVSDAKGIAMRVIGGFKNNAPIPQDNNFALKSMAVSVNDVPQKIYDDILNGKAKNDSELKQPVTYELLGWDMARTWNIDGGIGYPYLRENAADVTPDAGGEGGESGGNGNDGEGENPEIVDVPNKLVLKNAEANVGSQIILPVEMTNRDEIIGFQFELCLPQGITVARDKYGDMINLAEDRDVNYRTHVVTSKAQPSGNIQVLCYSNDNIVFSGNSGKVLNITLNVGKDMTDGVYSILLKNVVLTSTSLQREEAPQAKADITLSSYTLGDVNNDHFIDVSDIAGIVAYILNSPTEGLIKQAADANQDGFIDVSDIANVVNIILNGGKVQANTLTKQMKSIRAKDRANLEILPFTINKAETKIVDVLLNNPNDVFTGLQFDLKLPKGVSLEKNRFGYDIDFDGVRTDYRIHTISSSLQQDGCVRIVLYSAKEMEPGKVFPIDGKEGAVLKLKLKGDENLTDQIGDVEICNVVLTHEGGNTNVKPAPYVASVISGNPKEKDVVLKGHYTKDVLNTFGVVLNNPNITSVDFTGASEIDGTATFNVTNPNALIYLPAGQSLANENNIVCDHTCASLLLTDGYPLNVSKAFTANQASYTRDITNDGWYSICLPFAANIPANATVESFTSLNADQNVVNFSQVNAMEANIPYIFKAGSNTEFVATDVEVPVTDNLRNGIFTGTFTLIPAGSITGQFALRKDGTGFGICTSSAFVPAFRAYLNANVRANSIKLSHDGITSIEDINLGYTPMDIYSTDGKLVKKQAKNLDGLKRGVYIINGKKVIK